MVPLILLPTELVKFLHEDRLSWCLPLCRTCQQQTWMHNSSALNPIWFWKHSCVDYLSWMTMSSSSANPSWPQPSQISGMQFHLQPLVRHLSPRAVIFTASLRLQGKKKKENKNKNNKKKPFRLILLCPVWRSRVCYPSYIETWYMHHGLRIPFLIATTCSSESTYNHHVEIALYVLKRGSQHPTDLAHVRSHGKKWKITLILKHS